MSTPETVSAAAVCLSAGRLKCWRPVCALVWVAHRHTCLLLETGDCLTAVSGSSMSGRRVNFAPPLQMQPSFTPQTVCGATLFSLGPIGPRRGTISHLEGKGARGNKWAAYFARARRLEHCLPLAYVPACWPMLVSLSLSVSRCSNGHSRRPPLRSAILRPIGQP